MAPLALSVTVVLLLWMVQVTRIDNLVRPDDEAGRLVDFILQPPSIDTIVLAPVKPEEPLVEPETYDIAEAVSVDEPALNMRTAIKFESFKKPQFEIDANFAYMGLGLRQVLGSRAKPSYPREAKNAQVEGTVFLQYDINTRGIPVNIHILESQPEGIFDQAAIKAVKKWRYAKKYSDGAAISTLDFRNRINFRLDEMNLVVNLP